jgi:hypothetical protein
MMRDIVVFVQVGEMGHRAHNIQQIDCSGFAFFQPKIVLHGLGYVKGSAYLFTTAKAFLSLFFKADIPGVLSCNLTLVRHLHA